MADKLVKITIDEQEYQVRPGRTILSVCQGQGIDIPSLCYLEGISQEAACSVCLVEVKGAKTLIRSCVTKIKEGMEIFTKTQRVYEARRLMLELILANHPLDCVSCDKDGDCQLQDLACNFNIKKSQFLPRIKEISQKEPTPWDTNPFIAFDPDKCILCGRCINACKNQAVLEAIGFMRRGYKQKVSTPFVMPLEETDCQFCAECVQACPAAALIEKTRLNKGRLKDLISTDTICAYCGVGCNIRIYRDKQSRLIAAEGIENEKINNGRLCVKGRFGFSYVNSQERLTSPLIRKKGKLRKATWEEAINYTAEKLSGIKNKYGPEAIGILGSSRCTNEDNYVIQKFSRAVIGTNNVDNCARLCHSSTVVGLGMAFGAGAATNSLQDIEDSDVIFIIGSNMSETHPVIAQLIKAHHKKNKPKLIVCDPRQVGMAKIADIYIQHFPGTDTALLNGIMKLIIDKGQENKEFIAAHTEGFAELKEIVKNYNVKTVSKITGVAQKDLEQAAQIIAQAKAIMIFFAMGITQHTTGVDNVLSVANLALLTGSIGRPGAGIMPLRGQANVQGACDMGVMPNVFTGYQKITDSKARTKFEEAWKMKLPNKEGMAVSEFAEAALRGDLKAAYIMGENPLMTEADINQVKKGFKELEFIAVQNIFLSETAEIADVVFPAAAAYEKDGTFTNTDRTVQLLRKAVEKPAGTKYDWEIVLELAEAMGYKMGYKNSEEIMNEISNLTPSYAGISYGRLEELKGIQWPCPDTKHPGTAILYAGGNFKRQNGKGLFSAIEYKKAKELPDKKYPFILTTGRILYHYHSGHETRRVKPLHEFVPRNYVEINKEDAKILRIKEGKMVRVSTKRGQIQLRARISEQPKKGVIFIPFHFREAAANILTNAALDPLAKIPEFKVCAARIEQVVKRGK